MAGFPKDKFLVFPLFPNSKLPAIKAWNDSAEELYKWELTGYTEKETNWGLLTGPDNDLAVIDIDYKSGGAESEKLINLPPTFTVKTPNGKHLYYYYPTEGIRNSASKIAPGIDVRGDGGYVVAPYSTIDGKQYTPDKDFNPAPFPQTILDLLKPQQPADKEQRANSGSSLRSNHSSNGEDIVVEGGRNDYLTRLAGVLRRANVSTETIRQALATENEERLVPPLEDQEVETIVQSIGRYEAEEPLQPESLIVKASELTGACFTFLKDDKAVMGTPSGIRGYNELLGGGRRLGELDVLHAEAKTGKNTFWAKLMYEDLEKDIPVAFASRELRPDTEVIPNILSILLKKNVWENPLTGNDLEKAKQRLEKWPLYFAKGYGYLSIDQTRSWVEAMQSQGVKHFWFDHLHYMLEDPEDHKAASKLIKQLKTMAIDLQIHIDLIIQPNQLMPGQALSLRTIKGGSAMGQCLDNLFTMVRVEGENMTKISLKAGRSKLTKKGDLLLRYLPETCDFQEMTIEAEPAPKILIPNDSSNVNFFKGKWPKPVGNLRTKG